MEAFREAMTPVLAQINVKLDPVQMLPLEEYEITGQSVAEMRQQVQQETVKNRVLLVLSSVQEVHLPRKERVRHGGAGQGGGEGWRGLEAVGENGRGPKGELRGRKGCGYGGTGLEGRSPCFSNGMQRTHARTHTKLCRRMDTWRQEQKVMLATDLRVRKKTWIGLH